MPHLSHDHIQAVFDALGIGTETERQRFRDLATPIPRGDESYCPIRLDIGSSSPQPEDEHAKLASAAGRDKGQR